MSLPNAWNHYISIAPDVDGNGVRGWYAAVHDGEDVTAPVLADGTGRTIELALCDLIDNLAGMDLEHK